VVVLLLANRETKQKVQAARSKGASTQEGTVISLRLAAGTRESVQQAAGTHSASSVG